MEGREAPEHGNVRGKDGGDIELHNRINETRADSETAREMPHAALTTLAHHIDIDWLRQAYRRTRKNGATGVDRQTAEEYAGDLEENLRSLLERALLSAIYEQDFLPCSFGGRPGRGAIMH